LTAQLPPLTAAIDFSCKTAFRNIFSGELFDLSAPAAFYWNPAEKAYWEKCI
jgi:hypothetical protein